MLTVVELEQSDCCFKNSHSYIPLQRHAHSIRLVPSSFRTSLFGVRTVRSGVRVVRTVLSSFGQFCPRFSVLSGWFRAVLSRNSECSVLSVCFRAVRVPEVGRVSGDAEQGLFVFGLVSGWCRSTNGVIKPVNQTHSNSDSSGIT